MKRKIKMFLYADPGVGKSTFASKAPNPLFLCTDGNFEWLDLPDKNHIQLTSYAQFKTIVADICNGKYNEFETIVVDLVEDLYTWAIREFCASKKRSSEHLYEPSVRSIPLSQIIDISDSNPLSVCSNTYCP